MIGKESKFRVLLKDEQELRESIIIDFTSTLLKEVEKLVKEKDKEEIMQLIED